MTRTTSAILAALLILPASLLRSQSDNDNRFTEKLLQNRYRLSMRNGQLTGAGADLLKAAFAQSRFILAGEEHGLAETAEFWKGICNTAVPQGFHTMAIEEGPLVAAEFEQWASRADGQSAVSAFQKQYPGSINIYSTREELGMLQQCARTAPGAFHLWGLNQEAPGAGGLILSRILDTKPKAEVAAAMQRLLQKSEAADKKALQSGTFSDWFMLSANEADLAAASRLVQEQGSARVQSLFGLLIDSHKINLSWPAEASRRLRLMKKFFAENYKTASQNTTTSPKVLLKFGAYHIYRGWNPVHLSSIGNYVAEFADGAGAQSLHIDVMAVKRSTWFRQVGQPDQLRQFNLKDDPSARYLQPMLTNLLNSDWTLFDLRALRQVVNTTSDLATLVFGVDILVMVPDGTASNQIR
jgi:hypothetical protein